MTAVRAPRLVRGMIVLTVLFGVGTYTLFLLSFDTSGSPGGKPSDIPVLVMATAFIAGFAWLGARIAARQPGNGIGWLFCLTALAWAAEFASGGYAEYALASQRTSSTMARIADWYSSWGYMPGYLIPAVFLVQVFPDGRPLSPRWRPFVWIAAAGIIGSVVTTALEPGPLEDATFLRSNPFGLDRFEALLDTVGPASSLLLLVAALASAVSLLLRLRRATGERRQQVKWLVYAGAVLIVTILGTAAIGIAFQPPSGSLMQSFMVGAILLAVALIPAAAGIAILKYRLYDIDVVISKTVVFGGLAAFITAVYVALVVGVGSLLRSGEEPNAALSILATAVVAIAFQPVRERVQRFANRLVYGRRATPYEVMADFSHRVAGTISVEEMLPAMAETAARGVGAAGATVRLFLPDERERTVSWPDGAPLEGLTTTIPAIHQGERVGEIAVTKPPGEPVTPAERRILSDLAGHAGLALRNVRLTVELEARLEQISTQTEDLRRSRQRLVTARDTQRRHLEHDLREGPERDLVGIERQLRIAAETAARDPGAAAALLEELGAKANDTLEELRDVARGIFPPLLADRGMVAALESHVRKIGIDARLRIDPMLADARFDPDVEAAVYFCCVQALKNVQRHAPGSRVTLALDHAAGGLTFTVTDQGPGFNPATTPTGMGLQIMRDRIEALGGGLELTSAPGRGTSVRGQIPAREIAGATP